MTEKIMSRDKREKFSDLFYRIITPAWERDVEGVWPFVSDATKSTLRRLLNEDDAPLRQERIDAKHKELGR